MIYFLINKFSLIKQNFLDSKIKIKTIKCSKKIKQINKIILFILNITTSS